MHQIFRHPIQVQPTDIDQLKHVNNEVYLRWLMEAAIAHIADVGYPLEKILESGAAFVVRRHELDYLGQALLNDELVVETWLSEQGGPKCVREYKIVRPRDQKMLLKAKTLWVYIDLARSRPMNIPQPILDTFAPFLEAK